MSQGLELRGKGLIELTGQIARCQPQILVAILFAAAIPIAARWVPAYLALPLVFFAFLVGLNAGLFGAVSDAGVRGAWFLPELGEALIDAAAAWARSAGCTGLDGLALPGDRHVKNLYERSGMTARELTTFRELRP